MDVGMWGGWRKRGHISTYLPKKQELQFRSKNDPSEGYF
jgi:hypothetical protein